MSHRIQFYKRDDSAVAMTGDTSSIDPNAAPISSAADSPSTSIYSPDPTSTTTTSTADPTPTSTTSTTSSSSVTTSTSLPTSIPTPIAKSLLSFNTPTSMSTSSASSLAANTTTTAAISTESDTTASSSSGMGFFQSIVSGPLQIALTSLVCIAILAIILICIGWFLRRSNKQKKRRKTANDMIQEEKASMDGSELGEKRHYDDEGHDEEEEEFSGDDDEESKIVRSRQEQWSRRFEERTRDGPRVPFTPRPFVAQGWTSFSPMDDGAAGGNQKGMYGHDRRRSNGQRDSTQIPVPRRAVINDRQSAWIRPESRQSQPQHYYSNNQSSTTAPTTRSNPNQSYHRYSCPPPNAGHRSSSSADTTSTNRTRIGSDNESKDAEGREKYSTSRYSASTARSSVSTTLAPPSSSTRQYDSARPTQSADRSSRVAVPIFDPRQIASDFSTLPLNHHLPSSKPITTSTTTKPCRSQPRLSHLTEKNLSMTPQTARVSNLVTARLWNASDAIPSHMTRSRDRMTGVSAFASPEMSESAESSLSTYSCSEEDHFQPSSNGMRKEADQVKRQKSLMRALKRTSSNGSGSIGKSRRGGAGGGGAGGIRKLSYRQSQKKREIDDELIGIARVRRAKTIVAEEKVRAMQNVRMWS